VVGRLRRDIVDKGDAAVILFEDRADLLCGVQTRDIAVSHQQDLRFISQQRPDGGMAPAPLIIVLLMVTTLFSCRCVCD
jgi:hypothetical protein